MDEGATVFLTELGLFGIVRWTEDDGNVMVEYRTSTGTYNIRTKDVRPVEINDALDNAVWIHQHHRGNKRSMY
jgi:hypothetical protein